MGIFLKAASLKFLTFKAKTIVNEGEAAFFSIPNPTEASEEIGLFVMYNYSLHFYLLICVLRLIVR